MIKCEDCGREVFSKNAKRCKKCAGIKNSPTKITWPNHITLLAMVEKDGYKKVAEKLGVSVTSIRKRIGKY